MNTIIMQLNKTRGEKAQIPEGTLTDWRVEFRCTECRQGFHQRPYIIETMHSYTLPM